MIGTISDLIIENDCIWYLLKEVSGLFKYEIGLDKASLVARFDGYGLYNKDMFKVMVSYLDKIVIAPSYGKELFVFDKNTQKLSKLEYVGKEDDLIKLNSDVCNKFSCGIVHGEKVYLIGFAIGMIAIVDVKNNTFTINIPEKSVDLSNDKLARQITYDSERIYLPCLSKGSILTFDFNNENWEVYRSEGYDGIDELVMVGDKLVAVAELSDQFCIVGKRYSNIQSEGRRRICRAFASNDRLVLVPFRGNRIRIIDVNNSEEEVIYVNTNGDKDINRNIYSSSGITSDGIIWATYNSIQKIDLIDVSSKEIKSIVIPDIEGIEENCCYEDFTCGILYEMPDVGLSLNSFVNLLCRED